MRNKEFSCENDAKSALEKLSSKLKYHEIIVDQIISQDCYADKGRPKKTDKPIKTIFYVTGFITSLFENRKKRLMQHSCYVIGTNALDSELSSEEVIEAYKNQNASIERGFRFLKDPHFFVSSFFLKKPSRIMALLMIMTLSLLIYSVTQRHLRAQLKEENETLPNQIDKPIQNPTMRWIFQLMEGIDVIYITVKNKTRRIITGITETRKKIIQFFSPPVRLIYQVE